jgi:hypothetical protein
MPPKAVNKRKSVGDAPNDREKKVRSNGDEPSVQEQHDRAKQWHEQRQAARSKSPAPRRQSAAAGAKSPAPRRQSAAAVVKSPAAVRAKSPAIPARDELQKAKEWHDRRSSLSPPTEVKPKAKRSANRRQTIDVPVKPRTAPLASTMEETKSFGFKTIEERQNSQPRILAPKRSLESASGNDGHVDGDDASQGMSLFFIVFLCVSLGVVFASIFHTEQSCCLCAYLSKRISGYLNATRFPLASAFDSNYSSGSAVGLAAGVLVYFLLLE